MAFTLKYYNEYESINGTQWRVEIYRNGSVAKVDEFKMANGGAKIIYDGKNSSDPNVKIMASYCEFGFIVEDSNQLDFLQSLSSDDAEDRYLIKIKNRYSSSDSFETYWAGFLKPSIVSFPDAPYPFVVKMRATDGFDLAKEINFSTTTTQSYFDYYIQMSEGSKKAVLPLEGWNEFELEDDFIYNSATYTIERGNRVAMEVDDYGLWSATPVKLTFTAAKERPYSTEMRIIDVIRYALGKIGLLSELDKDSSNGAIKVVQQDIKADGHSLSSTVDVLYNTRINPNIFAQIVESTASLDFEYMSCYDVIMSVLNTFNCRLVMSDGSYFIVPNTKPYHNAGTFTQHSYSDAVLSAQTSGGTSTSSLVLASSKFSREAGGRFDYTKPIKSYKVTNPYSVDNLTFADAGVGLREISSISENSLNNSDEYGGKLFNVSANRNFRFKVSCDSEFSYVNRPSGVPSFSSSNMFRYHTQVKCGEYYLHHLSNRDTFDVNDVYYQSGNNVWLKNASTEIGNAITKGRASTLSTSFTVDCSELFVGINDVAYIQNGSTYKQALHSLIDLYINGVKISVQDNKIETNPSGGFGGAYNPNEYTATITIRYSDIDVSIFSNGATLTDEDVIRVDLRAEKAIYTLHATSSVTSWSGAGLFYDTTLSFENDIYSVAPPEGGQLTITYPHPFVQDYREASTNASNPSTTVVPQYMDILHSGTTDKFYGNYPVDYWGSGLDDYPTDHIDLAAESSDNINIEVEYLYNPIHNAECINTATNDLDDVGSDVSLTSVITDNDNDRQLYNLEVYDGASWVTGDDWNVLTFDGYYPAIESDPDISLGQATAYAHSLVGFSKSVRYSGTINQSKLNISTTDNFVYHAHKGIAIDDKFTNYQFSFSGGTFYTQANRWTGEWIQQNQSDRNTTLTKETKFK